ncbi:TlpA family protein disulfide reductase [Mycoplasmoides alvi]|uniref:TlpA family protein disulfide reductase n=1 Tax=Mycoplasmoides alvi TaxID=78580 RepID=UPI00051AFB48|nr:thioredoxin family protein [Mycoplasmoides alvi]
MEFKNIDLNLFEDIINKKNEPVLGIFFGTWCNFCQINIPEIITYFAEIKANYDVYMIHVEESDNVWLEDNNQKWKLIKVPTFRVYDNKKIIAFHEGPIKPKKLETMIKTYLIKK